MKPLLEYFVRSATDWLFRRRLPGWLVMSAGLGCLAISVGTGLNLKMSFPWHDGKFEINFDNVGSTPEHIVYAFAILGIFLILVGLVIVVHYYWTNHTQLSRKKIIVIETRGLRDTSGTPLIEAVPRNQKGQRDPILIDFRQRIQDGLIVEPTAVVERISSLPREIEQRIGGIDRRDVSYVYGGLAPVPLTFLTGVLFDDEGKVTILDWDRHAESWRMLDECDDRRRFAIVGVDEIPAGSEEVALVVSVSYRIDVRTVREKIGGIPLIEMVLDDGQPDCHWSEEKQRALGKQFFNTVHTLKNVNVQRIHLFLAAQNSVVFRFGKLYDKRNFPEVSVYQYQPDSHPPYPWAVRMPVDGASKADVI